AHPGVRVGVTATDAEDGLKAVSADAVEEERRELRIGGATDLQAAVAAVVDHGVVPVVGPSPEPLLRVLVVLDEEPVELDAGAGGVEVVATGGESTRAERVAVDPETFAAPHDVGGDGRVEGDADRAGRHLGLDASGDAVDLPVGPSRIVLQGRDP